MIEYFGNRSNVDICDYDFQMAFNAGRRAERKKNRSVGSGDILNRWELMARSIEKNCDLNELPSTSGAAYSLAEEIRAAKKKLRKVKR